MLPCEQNYLKMAFDRRKLETSNFKIKLKRKGGKRKKTKLSLAWCSLNHLKMNQINLACPHIGFL